MNTSKHLTKPAGRRKEKYKVQVMSDMNIQRVDNWINEEIYQEDASLALIIN